MPEPKVQNILPFTLPSGLSFNMIFVEGGAFDMGDEHGDLWDTCRPVHPVRLSDFYLAEFPMTQSLWRAVAQSPAGKQFGLDEDPSGFKGDMRPVEQVSWDDIEQKFLPALRLLTGHEGFRLPTEAQWEYAARGGKYWNEGYKYAGSDKLPEVGWYDKNSGDETHDVGFHYPNQLGIYDLSGNVWEWCADTWDEEFYEKSKKQGIVSDPCCEQGGYRVVRGGSCFNEDQGCLAANRNYGTPAYRGDDIGFRLALQSVDQSIQPVREQ